MSRPLGLSQQDYEELEKPRLAAEAAFTFSLLTPWEKCLLALTLALTVPFFIFLYVAAQLSHAVERVLGRKSE